MDVSFPAFLDFPRSLNGRDRKISSRSEKELTCEVKIDSLEKFAKTSPVAEAILDRPN